jgi:hypothetical protein
MDMDLTMPPWKKVKYEPNFCRFTEPYTDGSKHAFIIDERVPSDLIKPKRIHWFVAEKATVLHINIKEDNTERTAMSAMQVAQRVIDLYSCVGQAAIKHGISHVEYRTDSFVCILDDSICVGDPIGMLFAFASDLRQRLANLTDPYESYMGIALGATTLLESPLAIVGGAANIAEDMARLEISDAVAVHESALWRWASAARRPLPLPLPLPVACASGRHRRVTAFDLGSCSFHPAPAAAAAAAQKVAAAAPQRRRSASLT